jgi:hypothetical protein
MHQDKTDLSIHRIDWDMIYPTFLLVSDRGLIPNINLPRNYLAIIPLFYENNGKEIVETYVSELKKEIKGTRLDNQIKLDWDDKKGLYYINVGTDGGLDLKTQGWPGFAEHNLGPYNGFIAGIVAMKYVSELIKSSR